VGVLGNFDVIAILSGLLAGAVHVWSGPDHLAAVAPLSMSRDKRPWKIGVRWGVGHATGVILVGVLAYFFRELISSEWVSSWSERLVGIALIGIGLWGVRKAMSKRVHTHEHSHHGESHLHIHTHEAETAHAPAKPKAHFHTHTAMAIGTLHGLAGSSHLFAVLPSLAMPSRAEMVGYLLAYGVGTIVSMAFFATIMDVVARKSWFHGVNAYRFVTATISVAAIGIGCFWFWRSWPWGAGKLQERMEVRLDGWGWETYLRPAKWWP
jgi:sulfite exporter TauE/SafE